jgi:hypothetical protein
MNLHREQTVLWIWALIISIPLVAIAWFYIKIVAWLTLVWLSP